MDMEEAVATPRSPVSVQVTMRGHALVQDKPAASGGRDEGPMASELLLAGLLACQHSTFVKVAAKRGLAATVRSIRGELHFQDGDIAAVKVRFLLHAPGAQESAIRIVLRLTDRACTLSKALRVPVQAGYSLEPASSA